MDSKPHIRGWHPDPLDETQLRYRDGEKWGNKSIPARPGERRPSQVAPTPGAAGGTRGWTVNWSNIASFRVLFGAFLIAGVVAILPSMLSSALGGVVFVMSSSWSTATRSSTRTARRSTAPTVGSGSRRGLPPATTAARPSPPS